MKLVKRGERKNEKSGGLCPSPSPLGLQANAGVLPRSLAMDGKSVGDGCGGMTITLCRHEDVRPAAIIPAIRKKEDSESPKPASRSPIRMSNSSTRSPPPIPFITMRLPCRSSLKNGGDYLIGTTKSTSRHWGDLAAPWRDPFLT